MEGGDIFPTAVVVQGVGGVNGVGVHPHTKGEGILIISNTGEGFKGVVGTWGEGGGDVGL